MSTLVTPFGNFRLHRFEMEKDFEAAVVSQVGEIFGDRRIYLDCKRRIGARGGKQSIPDAYLVDLSRPREPQLYVVENELSTHDLFKHIGVQLLQFSVSFPQAGRLVKQVLFDEIVNDAKLKQRCEKYAAEGAFRNLDHLLETLVFDCEFQALVIIDEVTDELQTVVKNLGFPVEVLEFRTYANDEGKRIFEFEPFLADVESIPESTAPSVQRRPISDLDTVVVPAHDDGFESVFLGENRWYAVRIHPSMARQLKYIAVYRVLPTAAITHYAPIRSIEPWKDAGKVVVNFSEPAREVGPLTLVKNGRVKALQGLRYTAIEKLKHATSLDEAF
jgi:hypothetical protein